MCNVIVVTFHGVFKYYISYLKQCLFCGHFDRYHTCIHWIHNYDDRFFIRIDVCLFLREHIQNHSSVSSFVKTYNTLFNCTLVHQSVLNGYLLFDVLCETEREFYCYVCGYHLSTLIMDLNRKIAFKMLTEEFEEITIDKNNIEPDLVDMESFWEKVELAVISKAFTRSNLESLNIKPNLHYWAPYICIKYRTQKSEEG